MGTAYDHLSVVLGSLAKVDGAFQEARRKLSSNPETENTYFYSHFGDFTVAGTAETGTSWEIEVSAYTGGAEARWKLELELMHSSHCCELTAEAGFQARGGPMALREIPAVQIGDLDDLDAGLCSLTEQLFQDLDGDCAAAVEADQAERRSIESAAT